MLWGYIGPRYLGDFVPFLVLASAVAMADISRRLEGRRRRIRVGAVAVIAVVALFSIVANIGIAIVPNEEWTSGQAVSFVSAQKTVSDLTGHPLQGRVTRGDTLPPWAPAGQLDVIGDCSGLYISNRGELLNRTESAIHTNHLAHRPTRPTLPTQLSADRECSPNTDGGIGAVAPDGKIHGDGDRGADQWAISST